MKDERVVEGWERKRENRKVIPKVSVILVGTVAAGSSAEISELRRHHAPDPIFHKVTRHGD